MYKDIRLFNFTKDLFRYWKKFFLDNLWNLLDKNNSVYSYLGMCEFLPKEVVLFATIQCCHTEDKVIALKTVMLHYM